MMRNKSVVLLMFIPGLLASFARAQTGELVPVVSKPVSRTVEPPGEFLPFQTVSLHARVVGYVERVLVDRGSRVKTRRLTGGIERS